MTRFILLAFAGLLSLSVSACYTPQERALGGAAIGGLTGAAVGSAVSGNSGGALAGAAIGAAGGALIGAGTAPSSGYYRGCRYYYDRYGNAYCR